MESPRYSENLVLTGETYEELLNSKILAQQYALGLYSSPEYLTAVPTNVEIDMWNNYKSTNPMAEGYNLNPRGSNNGGVDPNSLLDYGGLAALVRSGEGSWNSYNRGSVGNGKKPRTFVNLTIGQVEGFQTLPKSHRDYVFAVGAYQFTPGVLSTARQNAGFSTSDYFTPQNQNKLFWGLILNGKKRPKLRDYLKGKSDNLNAAWLDLAQEWAAVQLPSGRGYYDGDKAGNHASISAKKVRIALEKARKEIIAAGIR